MNTLHLITMLDVPMIDEYMCPANRIIASAFWMVEIAYM